MSKPGGLEVRRAKLPFIFFFDWLLTADLVTEQAHAVVGLPVPVVPRAPTLKWRWTHLKLIILHHRARANVPEKATLGEYTAHRNDDPELLEPSYTKHKRYIHFIFRERLLCLEYMHYILFSEL